LSIQHILILVFSHSAGIINLPFHQLVFIHVLKSLAPQLVFFLQRIQFILNTVILGLGFQVVCSFSHAGQSASDFCHQAHVVDQASVFLPTRTAYTTRTAEKQTSTLNGDFSLSNSRAFPG
jgi:hypothetical protein